MSQNPQCVSGHSAFIFDRGGSRPLGPAADLSMVQWARLRDNVSEAKIRIEGDNCSHRDNERIIAQARTHRHELVIFRGDERVWEGPLHRITTGSGYAEFVAHDVGEYLFNQPLTQAYENSTLPDGTVRSTTVTGRIENIIQYEFSHGRDQFYPDTAPDAAAAVAEWAAAGGTLTPVTGGWTVHIPAFESDDIWPSTNILDHLDVRHFVNEARTAMDTAAYETSVGTHLQNLARQNGIDFTILGRSIIIWDVSRNLGVLQTMTDSNFAEDVITSEYGSDHTQAAFSVGQNGVYGSAVNLKNLAFYGPWTSMYTVYNEDGTLDPQQSDLDSQARRNLSGRSPAPIEVRIPDNSSIFLSPEVGINSLIPGVQVPLRATLNLRQLAQQQKIDSVTVTERGGAPELVQITLTPATKPDEDVAP
jgi:hypothetical protein